MDEVVSAAGAPEATGMGLTSVDGLRLHNLAADAVTLHGKPAMRLTQSQQTAARVAGLPPKERSRLNQLASIEGVEFSSGVIEAEIAGDVEPGAVAAARGFVGIAFRVQPDSVTYDAFYLRPTNGRAHDQERRNHSAQYVSHPDWPWFRLREETPSRYEAYVDLVPNEWVNIRIEVRGDNARLYVHDNPQPTLIVNDVKSGVDGVGGIALWIGPETVGHFRNLTVRAQPKEVAQTAPHMLASHHE